MRSHHTPTLLTLLFSLVSPSTCTILAANLTDHTTHVLIPAHILPRQQQDLQTFSSALGGTRAASITQSTDPQRPFMVNGDTFPQFAEAGMRSCDVQYQGCQGAANGAGKRDGDGNGNGKGGGNGDGKGGNGDGKGNGRGGKGNGDNKGNGNGNGGLTVQACDQQRTQCYTTQQNAQVKDFKASAAAVAPSQTQPAQGAQGTTTAPVGTVNIGPDPAFPDFDLICEG